MPPYTIFIPSIVRLAGYVRRYHRLHPPVPDLDLLWTLWKLLLEIIFSVNIPKLSKKKELDFLTLLEYNIFSIQSSNPYYDVTIQYDKLTSHLSSSCCFFLLKIALSHSNMAQKLWILTSQLIRSVFILVVFGYFFTYFIKKWKKLNIFLMKNADFSQDYIDMLAVLRTFLYYTKIVVMVALF